MSDTANRASVQCSGVHGNGEKLCGDTQLRHQGSVHKAFVGPRVHEHLERFRPVTPQQDSMESSMSNGRLPVWPTGVLIPTDEPGIFIGQVDM